MTSAADPILFREGHGCRRFEGKHAIVTAGTAGIGLAICHRLLSEGCSKLVLCSRKQQNVDEAVAQLKSKYPQSSSILGLACNVTKPGALEQFVLDAGKFCDGRVDSVVSNVGVNPAPGNALELGDGQYDKLFDANVKSHWKLIKLVHPMLKPGASIVLTSSVGGFSPGFPIGLYGVTKTALIGLGRALATELGPQGIRINTLCPGLVKTKMAEMLWKDEENAKHYASFLGSRVGEPEDMAGTVAFLLSNDARHITGEAVVVSGGSQGRL